MGAQQPHTSLRAPTSCRGLNAAGLKVSEAMWRLQVERHITPHNQTIITRIHTCNPHPRPHIITNTPLKAVVTSFDVNNAC
jgi:hypothetical protein